MLQKFKDFIAGLEKEETPAPQPEAPTPAPAAPAEANVTVKVETPAPAPAAPETPPETPPVATAKETIIPPADVADPAKTTGGTVYDRLDRGEKVSAKEINEAWDSPDSDLKARLMKVGR